MVATARSRILSSSMSSFYREISFQESGGIVNDNSHETRLHNTRLLTRLFNEQSFQTIVIADDDDNDNDNNDSNDNKGAAFHFYPGVYAVHRNHVQLQVDSVMKFHRNRHDKHARHNTTMDQAGRPSPCLSFFGGQNVTLTSSLSSLSSQQQQKQQNRGMIHGGGPEWWGIPGIGYAQILEHRPYVLLFNHSTDVHLSHLVLQDAPFYHVQMTDVTRVHVHHMSIVSRRTTTTRTNHRRGPHHGAWDLTAFNTDGIDIAGNHVHVHDVDIWTQDDCIAVKDNPWSSDDKNKMSANMLFERVRASGLGLTIGSISGTTVRNITFRDSILYRTYKGIYTKFRSRQQDYHEPGVEPVSLIQDVLYENISIIEPLQWAIWIGAAQQNGGHTANPCHASPCSLCWPHVPGAVCHAVPNATYRNITLRDISIINPQGSPGVIQGSATHPMQNLVFDNVRVRYDKKYNDVSVAKLQEWFPCLQYEVNDPWVPRTRKAIWIMVMVVIALIARRACWRRRRNQTRLDQEIWAPHCGTKQRMAILLILRGIVAVPILLLVAFEIALVRRLYRVDEYFVCDFVTNGVALGDTYPVPNCLQDQTNGVPGNHLKAFPNWGEVKAVAFWGLVGAVTAIWWLMVLRTRAIVDSSREALLYASIDQQDGVNPGDPEILEGPSETFNDEEDSSDEEDRVHPPT